METLTEISDRMMSQARHIIKRLDIPGAWLAVGATPHLVGSVRMGLLMTHRDIDFHVYSPSVSVGDSFAAVAQMAACRQVETVQYASLLHTPEACIEWHMTYRDDEGEPWQIDMIHIVRGSRYDGFFERQADRIVACLTPERREAVLRLKYETPPHIKIMGIEYYRAVISGGVRTFAQLQQWRSLHPADGIVEWMP